MPSLSSPPATPADALSCALSFPRFDHAGPSGLPRPGLPQAGSELGSPKGLDSIHQSLAHDLRTAGATPGNVRSTTRPQTARRPSVTYVSVVHTHPLLHSCSAALGSQKIHGSWVAGAWPGVVSAGNEKGGNREEPKGLQGKEICLHRQPPHLKGAGAREVRRLATSLLPKPLVTSCQNY